MPKAEKCSAYIALTPYLHSRNLDRSVSYQAAWEKSDRDWDSPRSWPPTRNSPGAVRRLNEIERKQRLADRRREICPGARFYSRAALRLET